MEADGGETLAGRHEVLSITEHDMVLRKRPQDPAVYVLRGRAEEAASGDQLKNRRFLGRPRTSTTRPKAGVHDHLDVGGPFGARAAAVRTELG